jgi:hypothetical protein
MTTSQSAETSLYHSLPPAERRQLIVDRFRVLQSQTAVAKEVGCSESVVSRQLSSAFVMRPRGAPPADGSAVPLDRELTAMRRVMEALQPLPPPQRLLVVKQVMERLQDTP